MRRTGREARRAWVWWRKRSRWAEFIRCLLPEWRSPAIRLLLHTRFNRLLKMSWSRAAIRRVSGVAAGPGARALPAGETIKRAAEPRGRSHPARRRRRRYCAASRGRSEGERNDLSEGRGGGGQAPTEGEPDDGQSRRLLGEGTWEIGQIDDAGGRLAGAPVGRSGGQRRGREGPEGPPPARGKLRGL
jgi:hypothetical protein